MYKIILLLMALLITSCMSLERKFFKEPEKAAELCLKHYGCKDIEVKETTIIKYDTIKIKGDSIQCPPTLKPVEVKDEKGNVITDKTTGKPIIKYVEVPGEKIKCPDKDCVSKTIENNKETIIRDKAQDQVLEDIRKKNTILEEANKTKRNWIIVLSLLIGGYFLYRVIKNKIKSKTL